MDNGLLNIQPANNNLAAKGVKQSKDLGLLGQIKNYKETDLNSVQKHGNIFNIDGGLLDVKAK